VVCIHCVIESLYEDRVMNWFVPDWATKHEVSIAGFALWRYRDFSQRNFGLHFSVALLLKGFLFFSLGLIFLVLASGGIFFDNLGEFSSKRLQVEGFTIRALIHVGIL
jgi:hypothetical protein